MHRFQSTMADTDTVDTAEYLVYNCTISGSMIPANHDALLADMNSAP